VATNDLAAPVGTSQPTVPDLEILVRLQSRGAQHELTLQLKARDPALRLNYRPFGPVPLHLEPQAYFRDLFKEIEYLPLATTEQRQVAERKVAGVGARLCRELLPPELQQLLWSLRGRVRTVLIQSDEPWIPWEILQLQGREGQRLVPGPFLSQAFALTRWLRGVELRPSLPLTRIAVVVPDGTGLAGARRELNLLMGLANASRRIERIPARFGPVLDALDSGVWDGWHFSGHGLPSRSTDPDSSRLVLEEDEVLTPGDLSSSGNLGLVHPLVFLNGCSTGRGGLSLTGLGGWAARFIEAGAGAFVGSLWAIDDGKAATFAEVFYHHLLVERLPIGEAVQKARLALRCDGDPTWLAYIAFADPLADCTRAPALEEPIETLGQPAEVAARQEGAGSRASAAFRGVTERAAARPAAALGGLALLAALVAAGLPLLGLRTQRMRELLLGLPALTYPAGELAATGWEALSSLPGKALGAFFLGHPTVRWGSLALLALALAWLRAGGRPRPRPWRLAAGLTVSGLGLMLTTLFYIVALQAHLNAPSGGTDRLSCAGLSSPVAFETCSWLANEGNDGRREALNGILVWLLAATGVGAWAGWRARGSPAPTVAAVLRRGLVVLHLALLPALLAQLPLAHAFGRWGWSYQPVTGLSTTCDELDLARQIAAEACFAYDVSAGAEPPLLLLRGLCTPSGGQPWKRLPRADCITDLGRRRLVTSTGYSPPG